jgi:hypothetical protein
VQRGPRKDVCVEDLALLESQIADCNRLCSKYPQLTTSNLPSYESRLFRQGLLEGLSINHVVLETSIKSAPGNEGATFPDLSEVSPGEDTYLYTFYFKTNGLLQLGPQCVKDVYIWDLVRLMHIRKYCAIKPTDMFTGNLLEGPTTGLIGTPMYGAQRTFCAIPQRVGLRRFKGDIELHYELFELTAKT